jgi:sec-independent protein translocase protein TatB
MLTFGWGEIFLLVGIIVVVVGPKDLPKLIKQLSSFTRSIKKLSREFKTSLNDIADHEDFKEVKTSINEVNKIKEDLNIEGQLKSEIQSIKDTTNIIDKEVKDIKNIHNK